MAESQPLLPPPPPPFLHRLPDDLLERVFFCLPFLTIFRNRLVCRRWNSLLASKEFLLCYDQAHHPKWIAVFDGLGLPDERALLLYEPSLARWHRICFDFLPPQFDIAVAAAGGLLCIASKSAERNELCVCNPFSKAYRALPELRQELRQPHAVMEGREQGSFRIYVMSGHLMAVYDSRNDFWTSLNMGEPERPRSSVICEGSVYGLRDEGWRRWRIVSASLEHLNLTANQASCGADAVENFWTVVNQAEWGEIPVRVRQPRLLGGNGSILLVGGYKKSLLRYPCSTYIILRLDLATLRWKEMARMPEDFYWRFDDTSVVKIFGSSEDIFFFCKYPPTFVACNLSNGRGIWRRVVDCPDFRYCVSDLCKGFPFDPKLGMLP